MGFRWMYPSMMYSVKQAINDGRVRIRLFLPNPYNPDAIVPWGKYFHTNAGDDAKFDERYARNFGVKAHESTIKLFQEAAQNAKDADVKAWAQKTLPSLQHHLEMAQALPPAKK
jgi:hypothetical protein